MKNNTLKYILVILFLSAGLSVNAQITNLGSMYYQNQYIVNPAMAGVDQGFKASLGFNKQWSEVPGAPSAQFLTVDNGSNKVGYGLNLYSDKAGLLKRTRVMATYAYHLPLNANNDQLHFGLSLGALSERLATEDINGNPSDIVAQRFNEKGAMFDGDFGIGYTSGRLNLQAALPNLKNFLKEERYNTANWNTFLTAASYKFNVDFAGNEVGIEPKVVYRGIRGYDDLIDAGVNLTFLSNKINATAIYHSTESMSLGLGLNLKQLNVLAMYTSGTAAIRGYGAGTFDLGLSYAFRKK